MLRYQCKKLSERQVRIASRDRTAGLAAKTVMQHKELSCYCMVFVMINIITINSGMHLRLYISLYMLVPGIRFNRLQII